LVPTIAAPELLKDGCHRGIGAWQKERLVCGGRQA
jgi:hypothetical protein